jgi:hypothetical protein
MLGVRVGRGLRQGGGVGEHGPRVAQPRLLQVLKRRPLAGGPGLLEQLRSSSFALFTRVPRRGVLGSPSRKHPKIGHWTDVANTGYLLR